MRFSFLSIVAFLAMNTAVFAQENYNFNKFRQLYNELPTPNAFRTAGGAPGHEYYQQKADYEMEISIDDEKQILKGFEKVHYVNNSPDTLEYIWVQLDQNMRAKDSDTKKIAGSSLDNGYALWNQYRNRDDSYEGGFNLEEVKYASGSNAEYAVNKTMMRIEVPGKLVPGASFDFSIRWNYNINDRMKVGGRSGFEYFPKDKNYLYTIAQFFPRMAVYNDVEGWQNKQFLGRGEFTLPFGDYSVKLTVPEDHVVASTGTLQNPTEVLSAAHQERLKEAEKSYDKPVFIVNQEEAVANEAEKSTGTKTWHFKAKNVRDFGFASSRKFIWDAMAVKLDGKTVMAMSAYPKEGNPLWEMYSTKAVAQTLITYSRQTINYPYPVAWSIHTNRIGMEYPMICFNGGRPNADGTYSDRTKYGMISVIIHEVGHNYFPMIINSDERQWTWMDEGLNTFLQYLAEQEFMDDYPSRRGPAYKITGYMKGNKDRISPIMTNSESIFQFGNNAYGKPATALNILRETIMGKELFDYAFKKYAERWAFRHPSPADFFRTMEDASGVDLDWFWRGWFFTDDHVDIALTGVEEKTGEDLKKESKKVPPQFTSWLKDNDYFYELAFENVGGLVMPIMLEFEFEDGSKSKEFIPAEIWRYDGNTVTKVFNFDKKVVAVALDPDYKTADVDVENNYWPKKTIKTRYELYKERTGMK